MLPQSFYTVFQIAELCNVNTETVRRWTRNGALTIESRKNKEAAIVVSAENLEAFLNANSKYKTIVEMKCTGLQPQSGLRKECYSINEAAALLGVDGKTIRRWIRSGTLRAEKQYHQNVINAADLEAFLRENPKYRQIVEFQNDKYAYLQMLQSLNESIDFFENLKAEMEEAAIRVALKIQKLRELAKRLDEKREGGTK